MNVSSGPPLLFALFHTAHQLQERLEAAFSAVGLSSARFGVLDELTRANAPVALGEMAARLSCVRSNMTQLVDRLEAEGLVRRVADPVDRRSVRAELTPLGTARHEAGAAALQSVERAFGDALSESEHAALVRILAGLDGLSWGNSAGS